jgi:hypothetical protein
VALARVQRLTFSYPATPAPALQDVSLCLAPGHRGFGRAGATRLPAPPWRTRDRAALLAGASLGAIGALWL